MIVVLRTYGLSVVIYTHDHEPPHVHVMGDGVTKIQLVGADGFPVILYAKDATRAEQRRAVREMQSELLERWNRIHE